jgi:hypothetical protein
MTVIKSPPMDDASTTSIKPIYITASLEIILILSLQPGTGVASGQNWSGLPTKMYFYSPRPRPYACYVSGQSHPPWHNRSVANRGNIHTNVSWGTGKFFTLSVTKTLLHCGELYQVFYTLYGTDKTVVMETDLPQYSGSSLRTMLTLHDEYIVKNLRFNRQSNGVIKEVNFIDNLLFFY